MTCKSHLQFYCFLAYPLPAKPFNSWLYENVFHTSTFISFFLLFPVLETDFSFSFGWQILNLRSFTLNNTYPTTPYLTILALISFILLIFVVLMYHLYLLLWDLIFFLFFNACVYQIMKASISYPIFPYFYFPQQLQVSVN